MGNGSKSILFLIDNVGTGGAEKVLSNLCGEFSRRGYECYYSSNYEVRNFALFEDAKYLDLSIKERATVFGKVTALFLYWFKVLLIKKKIKPAATISFLERSNAVNVLSSCFGGKTVVSVRNNLELQYSKFSPFIGFLVKLFLSLIYFRRDVVVLSKGVGEQLGHFLFWKSNPIVIYNGYDISLLKSKAKELQKTTVKLPQGKTSLAVACRLDKQKGIDILLKAISGLPQHLSSQFVLNIYGDGPEKNELKKLVASRKLNEQVFFHGFVDNPWGDIARCDYFVFPSRWEGFGNSLAEAALLGIPSICSDCDYGPLEIYGISDKIKSNYKIHSGGIIYRQSSLLEDDAVKNLSSALSFVFSEKPIFDTKICSEKVSNRFSNDRIFDLWEGRINE